MNKRSPHEFQRDIEMTQRNVVFPDTLRNETRGCRNLMTSKQPLSMVQLGALSIMFFGLVGLMGELAYLQFRSTPGSGLSRVAAGLGGYVIVFALCGAVFLLLRWRVRKALAAAHRRPPFAK